MHDKRSKLVHRIGRAICVLVLLATSISCSDRDRISMQVKLTRSVSKLPFVIALDQGLYEKYGLDIEVTMTEPEFDGGIHLPSTGTAARLWRGLLKISGQRKAWQPDIFINGANGKIYDRANRAYAPPEVFLAATDCVVRAHIVARKGMERIDDLKGKRLGISQVRSNSGFIALLLAERMGWDPIHDLSIMSGGNDIDALRDGRVDAFVASERSYAIAVDEGFPVLAATSTWNAPIAGNSVRVNAKWLREPGNREAARRFLMATIEGIALLHQDRELTLAILAKWHGITNPAYAETVYEAAQWIPHKPYPCYDGIEKAIERYDSNEMRKYSPEDFYDDSLIRELDESGFIDSLYPSRK